MSIAMPPMTHRVGSAGFALLVRLFAGLKRKGRVIDVIWFQQDLDYARTILALADNTEDDSVREISASLREIMRDVLTPPLTADVAIARSGNAVAAIASTPAPDLAAPDDRYIGRLR